MEEEKGLLTAAQIEDICRIWAESLYDEDKGELLTSCLGAVKDAHPDYNRAELLAETVRLAYMRGFEHGVKIVSACWEDEPMPDPYAPQTVTWEDIQRMKKQRTEGTK